MSERVATTETQTCRTIETWHNDLRECGAETVHGGTKCNLHLEAEIAEAEWLDL